MFSKTCEYAIRAAVYISAESDIDNKVGIAEICSHIEAPSHFTAKILQTLGHHKIVSSQKGVKGGFYMDQQQNNTKIIGIVNAIDGDKLFTGCGLGLSECSETEPCPIHNQFKGIRSNIKKMLEETSVSDLASKLKKGKGFLRIENPKVYQSI